ncbi:S-adenosyl-L-methionine-dependent methyltransferase [Cristinia sonorae]|uniref:S-adenosyl-L-methionine-dependent methyltransferase n=1 Tax=Cristinia sonorae TaxID=1940300 RepID=A0A8K0XQ80_9AGAR|nr:S-adenosyl-L-methionine-dependent methyltransferase [Cristinia sonorae]
MSEHTHTHVHHHHGPTHSHSHGHSHGPAPEPQHGLTESQKKFIGSNAEHFDNMAEAYEKMPQAQELARRISTVMRETYPALFDEDKTEMLDYGCGPGLTSRELSPYVKTIVGVDISQAMIDLFNLRVANQGIPPEEMRAVKIELKGEEGELDGAKFDLIIVVAAYHHFADVKETTRMLTGFLKPGGSLLIADILDDGTGKKPMDDFKHVVPHTAGFSEEGMKALLEGAGLREFGFTIAIPHVRIHEQDVKIFLATAKRPVQ